MKRHWPVLFVALLLFLAYKQSSRIHARAVEQSELARRLENLNAELAGFSRPMLLHPVLTEAEQEALKRRADRVHKLRGDVTMARRELEQVTAKVDRLTKQYEARSNQLAFVESPEFPEGYRQGSALRNVGQASPEATVETFFHANIAGDMALAIPCFDELAGQQNLDADARQRTADQMKQMFARFPGYQLITREQLTPTKARLGIRTSQEANTIHIVLDLTARQWVINSDESQLFK